MASPPQTSTLRSFSAVKDMVVVVAMVAACLTVATVADDVWHLECAMVAFLGRVSLSPNDNTSSTNPLEVRLEACFNSTAGVAIDMRNASFVRLVVRNSSLRSVLVEDSTANTTISIAGDGTPDTGMRNGIQVGNSTTHINFSVDLHRVAALNTQPTDFVLGRALMRFVNTTFDGTLSIVVFEAMLGLETGVLTLRNATVNGAMQLSVVGVRDLPGSTVPFGSLTQAQDTQSIVTINSVDFVPSVSVATIAVSGVNVSFKFCIVRMSRCNVADVSMAVVLQSIVCTLNCRLFSEVYNEFSGLSLYVRQANCAATSDRLLPLSEDVLLGFVDGSLSSHRRTTIDIRDSRFTTNVAPLYGATTVWAFGMLGCNVSGTAVYVWNTTVDIVHVSSLSAGSNVGSFAFSACAFYDDAPWPGGPPVLPGEAPAVALFRTPNVRLQPLSAALCIGSSNATSGGVFTSFGASINGVPLNSSSTAHVVVAIEDSVLSVVVPSTSVQCSGVSMTPQGTFPLVLSGARIIVDSSIVMVRAEGGANALNVAQGLLGDVSIDVINGSSIRVTSQRGDASGFLLSQLGDLRSLRIGINTSTVEAVSVTAASSGTAGTIAVINSWSVATTPLDGHATAPIALVLYNATLRAASHRQGAALQGVVTNVAFSNLSTYLLSASPTDDIVRTLFSASITAEGYSTLSAYSSSSRIVANVMTVERISEFPWIAAGLESLALPAAVGPLTHVVKGRAAHVAVQQSSMRLSFNHTFYTGLNFASVFITVDGCDLCDTGTFVASAAQLGAASVRSAYPTWTLAIVDSEAVNGFRVMVFGDACGGTYDATTLLDGVEFGSGISVLHFPSRDMCGMHEGVSFLPDPPAALRNSSFHQNSSMVARRLRHTTQLLAVASAFGNGVLVHGPEGALSSVVYAGLQILVADAQGPVELLLHPLVALLNITVTGATAVEVSNVSAVALVDGGRAADCGGVLMSSVTARVVNTTDYLVSISAWERSQVASIRVAVQDVQLHAGASLSTSSRGVSIAAFVQDGATCSGHTTAACSIAVLVAGGNWSLTHQAVLIQTERGNLSDVHVVLTNTTVRSFNASNVVVAAAGEVLENISVALTATNATSGTTTTQAGDAVPSSTPSAVNVWLHAARGAVREVQILLVSARLIAPYDANGSANVWVQPQDTSVLDPAPIGGYGVEGIQLRSIGTSMTAMQCVVLASSRSTNKTNAYHNATAIARVSIVMTDSVMTILGAATEAGRDVPRRGVWVAAGVVRNVGLVVRNSAIGMDRFNATTNGTLAYASVRVVDLAGDPENGTSSAAPHAAVQDMINISVALDGVRMQVSHAASAAGSNALRIGATRTFSNVVVSLVKSTVTTARTAGRTTSSLDNVVLLVLLPAPITSSNNSSRIDGMASDVSVLVEGSTLRLGDSGTTTTAPSTSYACIRIVPSPTPHGGMTPLLQSSVVDRLTLRIQASTLWAEVLDVGTVQCAAVYVGGPLSLVSSLVSVSMGSTLFARSNTTSTASIFFEEVSMMSSLVAVNRAVLQAYTVEGALPPCVLCMVGPNCSWVDAMLMISNGTYLDGTLRVSDAVWVGSALLIMGTGTTVRHHVNFNGVHLTQRCRIVVSGFMLSPTSVAPVEAMAAVAAAACDAGADVHRFVDDGSIVFEPFPMVHHADGIGPPPLVFRSGSTVSGASSITICDLVHVQTSWFRTFVVMSDYLTSWDVDPRGPLRMQDTTISVRNVTSMRGVDARATMVMLMCFDNGTVWSNVSVVVVNTTLGGISDMQQSSEAAALVFNATDAVLHHLSLRVKDVLVRSSWKAYVVILFLQRTSVASLLFTIDSSVVSAGNVLDASSSNASDVTVSMHRSRLLQTVRCRALQLSNGSIAHTQFLWNNTGGVPVRIRWMYEAIQFAGNPSNATSLLLNTNRSYVNRVVSIYDKTMHNVSFRFVDVDVETESHNTVLLRGSHTTTAYLMERCVLSVLDGGVLMLAGVAMVDTSVEVRRVAANVSMRPKSFDNPAVVLASHCPVVHGLSIDVLDSTVHFYFAPRGVPREVVSIVAVAYNLQPSNVALRVERTVGTVVGQNNDVAAFQLDSIALVLAVVAFALNENGVWNASIRVAHATFQVDSVCAKSASLLVLSNAGYTDASSVLLLNNTIRVNALKLTPLYAAGGLPLPLNANAVALGDTVEAMLLRHSTINITYTFVLLLLPNGPLPFAAANRSLAGVLVISNVVLEASLVVVEGGRMDSPEQVVQGYAAAVLVLRYTFLYHTNLTASGGAYHTRCQPKPLSGELARCGLLSWAAANVDGYYRVLPGESPPLPTTASSAVGNLSYVVVQHAAVVASAMPFVYLGGITVQHASSVAIASATLALSTDPSETDGSGCTEYVSSNVVFLCTFVLFMDVMVANASAIQLTGLVLDNGQHLLVSTVPLGTTWVRVHSHSVVLAQGISAFVPSTGRTVVFGQPFRLNGLTIHGNATFVCSQWDLFGHVAGRGYVNASGIGGHGTLRFEDVALEVLGNASWHLTAAALWFNNIAMADAARLELVRVHCSIVEGTVNASKAVVIDTLTMQRGSVLFVGACRLRSASNVAIITSALYVQLCNWSDSTMVVEDSDLYAAGLLVAALPKNVALIASAVGAVSSAFAGTQLLVRNTTLEAHGAIAASSAFFIFRCALADVTLVAMDLHVSASSQRMPTSGIGLQENAYAGLLLNASRLRMTLLAAIAPGIAIGDTSRPGSLPQQRNDNISVVVNDVNVTVDAASGPATTLGAPWFAAGTILLTKVGVSGVRFDVERVRLLLKDLPDGGGASHWMYLGIVGTENALVQKCTCRVVDAQVVLPVDFASRHPQSFQMQQRAVGAVWSTLLVFLDSLALSSSFAIEDALSVGSAASIGGGSRAEGCNVSILRGGIGSSAFAVDSSTTTSLIVAAHNVAFTSALVDNGVGRNATLLTASNATLRAWSLVAANVSAAWIHDQNEARQRRSLLFFSHAARLVDSTVKWDGRCTVGEAENYRCTTEGRQRLSGLLTTTTPPDSDASIIVGNSSVVVWRTAFEPLDTTGSSVVRGVRFEGGSSMHLQQCTIVASPSSSMLRNASFRDGATLMVSNSTVVDEAMLRWWTDATFEGTPATARPLQLYCVYDTPATVASDGSGAGRGTFVRHLRNTFQHLYRVSRWSLDQVGTEECSGYVEPSLSLSSTESRSAATRTRGVSASASASASAPASVSASASASASASVYVSPSRSGDTQSLNVTATPCSLLQVGAASPSPQLYDVFVGLAFNFSVPVVSPDGVLPSDVDGVLLVSTWGSFAAHRIVHTSASAGALIFEVVSVPVVKSFTAEDVVVSIDVKVAVYCSVPVVTVVLRRTKLPTPEGVRTVSEVATAVAGTVAAVAGVGGGSAMQRAMLLLQLSVCEFSLAEQVPISDSPTQMGFGPDENAFIRGTVIGNLLLLCGFTVLTMAVSEVQRRRGRAGGEKGDGASVSFMEAWGKVSRMPGVLIAPLSIFMQPMIAQSLSLLIYPITAYDPVVGTMGLVTMVGIAGWLVWHGSGVGPGGRRMHALVSCREYTGRSLRSLSRMARWATPLSEWHPTHGHRIEGNDFLHHFGHVFEEFRAEREWFVLCDLVMSVVCGVLAAVKPTAASGCQGIAIAMLVACGCFAVLVLTLRPWSARIGDANGIANAASNVLCCAFLLMDEAVASDILALTFVALNVVLSLTGALALLFRLGVFARWLPTGGGGLHRIHMHNIRRAESPDDAVAEGNDMMQLQVLTLPPHDGIDEVRTMPRHCDRRVAGRSPNAARISTMKMSLIPHRRGASPSLLGPSAREADAALDYLKNIHDPPRSSREAHRRLQLAIVSCCLSLRSVPTPPISTGATTPQRRSRGDGAGAH